MHQRELLRLNCSTYGGTTIHYSSTTQGPWFEDFLLGDLVDDAPSVTVTEGHAAIHQALFGDRSRLPLDHHLCRQVTGNPKPLVNTSLVANIAIGQSTYTSQRVLGNLFYRGLRFQRPVYIGDTLRTLTRVVGLKQNRVRPDRANTGLVALEMQVVNQHEENVMLFWRCPMIPCRNADSMTGHADSFDTIPAELDINAIMQNLPAWDLAPIRGFTGRHFDDIKRGEVFDLEARDTVTMAPELVRMTLNMAMTHTDLGRSVYDRRLVYGGHTISLAAAQLSRVFPNIVDIVAWRGCDHLAPVFEEDILSSRITVLETLPMASGGLADLTVAVFAEREDKESKEKSPAQVLDWQLLARFA